MLRVELKRILKTRSTWWLFAIAFVLSIFFGFYTVRLSFNNDFGNIVRGLEAFKMNKENYESIKGEITPELIAKAVEEYHKIIAQYGNAYNVPPEISGEVIGPYMPVHTWIYNSFSNENGEPLSLNDISPEQALGFYQARLSTLEGMLKAKYIQNTQVLSYIQDRTDKTDTTFNYSYGIGSTNTSYHLSICTLVLTLICAVITTPIFSSDYASGADDILRCTRRGRCRLALSKLISAFIINLSIFILCIGTFLIITYTAFGFDDITSAELLGIQWNPDSLTAMGYIGIVLLSGILTFLAMTSFTLFLSSKLKSPTAVLAIDIAVALVPTVILILGIDVNMINWIRFCLPSGGLPMAMYVEFTALRFLWIGDFVTWSPYVILVTAAVQIPLWFGLAVRSYSKHQAT